MKPVEKITPQPWMTAPGTLAVIQALTKEGAEARFVGGCVRDAVLNRPVKDIDIATPLVPEEATRLLESLGADEPGARAELSTAETELEQLRLESTELLRKRNVEAQKLEDVARRIADRERELAVADERRVQAERRLQQID